jgi:ribosomal protein L3 glutamine methyltransferase
MSNYYSEAALDLKTVRDYLRFAVSRFNQGGLFFGHGSSDAYDEAAYLILHTLHLPLDRLEPFLDTRLTDSERSEVLNIIHRRVEHRIPAAYLTHQALLGEFSFYVDERVIVPRSFIAELLLEQLSPWIAEPEAIRSVLDLCTGSGCLAILAAHAFPAASVDAVDLSPAALAVAERNVADYQLQDRISLIESDMFAKLGLDATRTILKHAAQHLGDNGILVVEIGHNRDALEAAYPDLPFTWLDISAGDQFIFMLHRNDLLQP